MSLDFGPDALTLLALMIVTGAFAGFMAGLLGVGGGIVIVPTLFQLLSFVDMDPNYRMHVAVGTSIATLIPTSLRSVASHRKRGAVDDSLLRNWRWALIVGVLAGAALASHVSRQSLVAVFAVVALVVAVYMFVGRESWRLAAQVPAGPGGQAMAGGIGVISSLMGIGGGTLGVPLLTLFGFPIHRAVGTGAGLGLYVGIPGTIGYLLGGIGKEGLPPWSFGFVNLIGFLAVTPLTVYMAPWGAKAAHAMSRPMLRTAFGLFLSVVAARLFYDLLR